MHFSFTRLAVLLKCSSVAQRVWQRCSPLGLQFRLSEERLACIDYIFENSLGSAIINRTHEYVGEFFIRVFHSYFDFLGSVASLSSVSSLSSFDQLF